MNRSLPVSCRELDLAAVEAELVKHRCNIAAAARALGVPASDLRRLVSWGPLAAAASEQVEQALDEAEAILYEGLRSPDKGKRMLAAGQLLRLSPAARRRGFGLGLASGDEADPQPVAMKWLEPH